MKVLGKNVVIGTKKICMEYTSKISGGFSDCLIGSCDYKGSILEKNVIFVLDKKGYYVQLEDLKSFPNLSLICYGAAPRWKLIPHRAGDEYIDEIKPYFETFDQDTSFEIKDLIKLVDEKKIKSKPQEQVSVNL